MLSAAKNLSDAITNRPGRVMLSAAKNLSAALQTRLGPEILRGAQHDTPKALFYSMI